jgi:hypothetical protein
MTHPNGRNCFNCLNMRTRLPLVPKKGHPMDKVIDFKHASPARCALGLIQKGNGEEKVFEIGYLFREHTKDLPSGLNQAENCPFFVNMEGEDGMSAFNAALAEITADLKRRSARA